MKNYGKVFAPFLLAILLGSLTFIFAQSKDNGGFNAVTFGINDYDTLTPGDYDGDGKGDVAVWRETEGNYYVSRSLDNTISVVSWGLISDFPVASYDTH